MIVAKRKPFDEIMQLIKGYKKVLVVGCGTCVASCPAGAIQGRHFTDDQIMAQIEGLFRVPAPSRVPSGVEASLHKVAEEV